MVFLTTLLSVHLEETSLHIKFISLSFKGHCEIREIIFRFLVIFPPGNLVIPIFPFLLEFEGATCAAKGQFPQQENKLSKELNLTRLFK